MDTRSELKDVRERAAEELQSLTDLMKKQKTLSFRAQGSDGLYKVITLKEGKDGVSVTDSKEKNGTD